MFIYFLLSPSARPQFLFVLAPFARPFMAMLLKECLRIAVFAPLEDSAGSPFHCLDVLLSVFLFCLIVIAASALKMLVYLHWSSFLVLQVSFYLQRGSNSFPAINRTFLLSYTRRVYI